MTRYVYSPTKLRVISAITAAVALLSPSREAFAGPGCIGDNRPSGPLQNYCEYKCNCGPYSGKPSFYIQIMVPKGTTDCSGYIDQATVQAGDLCNPPPTHIDQWIPDGNGNLVYMPII
jgi:hypothetical protein